MNSSPENSLHAKVTELQRQTLVKSQSIGTAHTELLKSNIIIADDYTPGRHGVDAGVVAHALTGTEVLCGEHATTTNLRREAAPADSIAMPRVRLGVGGPRLLLRADLCP